jgi:hypothetical protein
MTVSSPVPRTAAQAEASRANGTSSRGPITPEGKAHSALNATRHGLCSTRFFLLPDEDEAEYETFLEGLLASLCPRDAAERQEAERAVQAMWRQSRADRLEAEILSELFGAKQIQDKAEAQAVRQAAIRAMSTLLRYRGRIERERDRALAAFHALRQRPRAAGTSEPDSAASPRLRRSEPPAPVRSGTSEPAPSRPLNRHERRRLAALERQARRAA